MNFKQRILILVFAIIFSLSELFPPWQYEYAYIDTYKHLCPAGYSFFTHPPAIRPYDEMLKICAASEVSYEKITTHKDSDKLTLQRIILIVASSGLWLIFLDQRSRIKLLMGSLLLVVGILASLLYLAIWFVS